MDIGKIYAGVFFGNTRKWTFKDKELEKAVYRAFNDWAMEQSNYAPDRIIALPWMHAQFPELCAPELYRLVDQGARAVEFSFADAEVTLPLWSPEWEPFYAAAEETNTVVCAHIGDASGTPYPPNEYGQSLAHFSQVPFIPAGEAHRAGGVQRGIRSPPESEDSRWRVPHRVAAVPLPVDGPYAPGPLPGHGASAAGQADRLHPPEYVIHLRGGTT